MKSLILKLKSKQKTEIIGIVDVLNVRNISMTTIEQYMQLCGDNAVNKSCPRSWS